MLRRLNVRAKLMGLLVGISLAALSVACVAFVVYDRMSYTESKQAAVTVLVDAVAQSSVGAVAFGDADSAAYVLKAIARDKTAVAAAIYHRNGGKRLTVWSPHREDLAPEVATDLPAESGIANGMLHIKRSIHDDNGDLGDLYAVFSTDDIDDRTRHFLSIAGLVLLFSFLAAWAVASLSHVVLTEPVTKLVAAVTKVQREQDFSVRAEKVSEDELGTLTDSFNEMVSVIQARDRELEGHRQDLERRVEERTRDLDARNVAMRLVLDNVDQGFVTIDRAGVLLSERSLAFDDFFGAPEPGARIWEHVGKLVPEFSDAFELGWDGVIDDLLPLELSLEQLPSRLQVERSRYLSLEYRPIMEQDELGGVLVIFTDISDQVARERGAAEQAETVAIFEAITHDASGFNDFFTDAQKMVERALDSRNQDMVLLLRDLHTLKGNFAITGLRRMAAEIHHIEGYCIENEEPPGPEQRAKLRELWQHFSMRVNKFRGDAHDTFAVDIGDYDRLVERLADEKIAADAMASVLRLRFEPVRPRLERLSQEAQRISRRLERGELRVDVGGEGTRIAPGSAWLWSALPHLVRNAIDHGYRPNPKFPVRNPVLHIHAQEGPDFVQIEVSDEGYGVNWERLRELAQERGLPHKTEADLIAVMFADQISTAAQATEISGRGVGLAAVKAAVEEHGGTLNVQSETNKGTKFTIRVRQNPLDSSAAPAVVRSLSA